VVSKNTGSARARRMIAYPIDALRESIVNAVFHRSYEGVLPAIRIALYPDRLEITSYPGPVPGVEMAHLAANARPPQTPPRNPRVGELLKALRLAETWHTGVPRIHRTMKDNGSPAPAFEFDVGRTYFRVTLPAHPGYFALNALREAAVFWHTGDRERGLAFLEGALTKVPQSGALVAQLIDYIAATGDLSAAARALTALEQVPDAYDRHLAYFALARAYLGAGRNGEATALLANVPRAEFASTQNIVDLAILHKRLRAYQEAHRAFASVAEAIRDDPKSLHEFAQTKLHLARRAGRGAPRAGDVSRRLNREAKQLLERVVQLAVDQPVRSAWAWYDLARVRAVLGEPDASVDDAIDRAISILPDVTLFHDWKADRRLAQRRHDYDDEDH
jgi:ATP-dependent DNA helicase RecG